MTTITVARTVEELEPLRGAWERLQGTHFPTSPDAFTTILRHRVEAIRPHVALLEQDGEGKALLLGRVEQLRLTTKLGYREVYAPTVRALTVVNEGLLGDDSEEVCRAFLASLRSSLAAGEADVLRLRNLRLGSTFHRVATTETSRLVRGRRSRPSVHWVLELPESLEAFRAGLSSSTRESLKRYERKLIKTYGDRLQVRTFREAAELDELFDQVGQVAAKTYQGGLGVAFSGDELQRGLTRLAMEQGLFRAVVVSIDGKPVAFWHGEGFRGVFRIGVPGYDPELGHLRVGNFALLRLVEQVCADDSVDTLDYGFGDAEYKRRFGTRNWEEEDVYLFATTAKGIRVNATRTVLLTATILARRALERGNVLDRVKREWRARLSRRRPS